MKNKLLAILAIASCFAFSGCGDTDNDDFSDFKPAKTASSTVKEAVVSAEASVNRNESQETGSQPESDTETTATTTAQETTTTTEPTTTTEQSTTTTTTEKTTTTLKLVAEKLIAAEKTYANGTITLSGTADPETGLVIVTLTNNFKSEAKLFGNPTIITVDNKSVDMDPYDNMHATASNVQPGTSADFTFTISTQYIKPGFKLSGELWAMGLFSDRQYSIEFQ